MATDRVVIPGIVKNGLVVPKSGRRLPDGAHVEIVIACAELTDEFDDDFALWERASDEAWDSIAEWERRT